MSQESFVSQIFLVEKKEGGTEKSSEPQGSQQLHKNGAFQDEGVAYPSRPDSSSGLDDKIRPEGCLPSDTDVSKSPVLPPVSVEYQDISVSVPSIWFNISTTSVYKSAETCGWGTEADGNLSDNLP